MLGAEQFSQRELNRQATGGACMALPLQASTNARGSTGTQFAVQVPGRCSIDPQNGLDRRRHTFCNSGCWYAVERYGPSVETSRASEVSAPKFASSSKAERRLNM
jgi:hypothetical protein